MSDSTYKRLMSRICMVPPSGCWIFMGALKAGGYGDMWHKGKVVGAHRVAYELLVGPIPEGMDVCHRCDVRSCVNPHHLFIGTRAENMADCVAKVRFSKKLRKLTDVQVNEIRESSMPVADLADAYKVGLNTIYRIKNGQQYWWVPRV